MNDLEIRQILDRRAAELAKPFVAPAAHGRIELQFVFRSHAETYAAAARLVREVFAMKHYTRVPGTPEFVMGIAGVHGEILALLDLGLFLGLPQTALTNLNTVAVVDSPSQQFGIVIDAPEGIRGVDMDALLPAPAGLPESAAGYVLGLTEDGVIVLNMDAILESGLLVIGGHEHTARAGGGRS